MVLKPAMDKAAKQPITGPKIQAIIGATAIASVKHAFKHV